MKSYFKQTTHAAPLAAFRIIFGMMLFLSIIRFWTKGWIYDLYIKPVYFFPFYGFEFIKPLESYTYVLFVICGLSALLVTLGYFYRIAIGLLFLSFTYIELIDKSTYLNHYYFVSMVLLLMMFLPANRYFSIDSFKNPRILADQIPSWCLDSLRFLVLILYFYAGLAKLNSDWLLHALPLKIWLAARDNTPLIGWLFSYTWVAYVFSWFACIYDLSIGFFLWNKKTRIWAYITVVVFHVFTAILFPIGMFPYIMIVTALVFFSADFHKRIFCAVNIRLKNPDRFVNPHRAFSFNNTTQTIVIGFFSMFFLVQLLMPFRYLLYPGELFWTEEGYRFSWRVMLMEKAGYTQFTVKDAAGNQVKVDNEDFLTPLQEKMMSVQPDMILQYAHILRDHYAKKGMISPQVYADSYVALNGRRGRAYISPNTDLAKEHESFKPKTWILPLNDEIKGF